MPRLPGRAPAPGGLVWGEGSSPTSSVLQQHFSPCSLLAFFPLRWDKSQRPATSLGFPRRFRAELPSTALPCLNSCCPVTLSPDVTSSKKQSLTADWIPAPPPAPNSVTPYLHSWNPFLKPLLVGLLNHMPPSLDSQLGEAGRSPSLILYSMWCTVPKPASAWWGLMGAMDRLRSLEPVWSYKQPAPCSLPRPNPA